MVIIKTRDQEYSGRVDFPKGEPENPLTDEEFRTRYDGLMEYAGIDRKVSDKVFCKVFEERTLVNELVAEL